MSKAGESTAGLREWLEQAWAVPPTTRFVEVEGAAIAYNDWGLPSAGAEGLVFVHGFLAHARWWDHIAPHFAGRFHAIATNLSGMGDSGWRAVYSREFHAREILAAIRDAGMARATVVAHSFGSLSALYASKLAPDLIGRVIVLDAHIFRDTRQFMAEEPMPEKRYPTREAALARYRLIPPGRWPVPELIDYIARHSLREVDGEWSWKFDPRVTGSIESMTMREAVRGLAVPVDYIHAQLSEVAHAGAVEAFVANLPLCGAPVTIPACHHHLMLEQPVALVAALDALLAHPR